MAQPLPTYRHMPTGLNHLHEHIDRAISDVNQRAHDEARKIQDLRRDLSYVWMREKNLNQLLQKCETARVTAEHRVLENCKHYEVKAEETRSRFAVLEKAHSDCAARIEAAERVSKRCLDLLGNLNGTDEGLQDLRKDLEQKEHTILLLEKRVTEQANATEEAKELPGKKRKRH